MPVRACPTAPRALAHRCPCSRCRRAAALSSQVDDLQGELGGAKKRIRKLEKERDVAISSLRSELSREVEEATKFLLQQLDGRGGAAPQGELPAAAAREIRQLKEEVASLQAGYAELSSSSARPPAAGVGTQLPPDFDQALWDSEVATALMERVAQQEQAAKASADEMGTLRQYIDDTETKLARMVRDCETQLASRAAETVQHAAAREEGTEPRADQLEELEERLLALESASTEAHWTEQTSSSGTRYYYNTKTKQSTWERPPGFQGGEKQPQRSMAEERAPLGDFDASMADETIHRCAEPRRLPARTPPTRPPTASC